VSAPVNGDELALRRSECIDAWEDAADPDSGFMELRGGPLDSFNVRWAEGQSVWEGAYYDDEGAMVLYRYEMGEDGPEYGGVVSMTDIADRATNAHEPLPLDAEPMIDLETMTADEATEVLIEDNERRVAELMEMSGGQVDLTNAFDILFIKTYLRHFLEQGHPKIAANARLDFEDQRSRMLDDITDKIENTMAEREKMMNQAKLMGQAVPPGPVHAGRVTTPARRVRR
jgi:hypothetical protein